MLDQRDYITMFVTMAENEGGSVGIPSNPYPVPDHALVDKPGYPANTGQTLFVAQRLQVKLERSAIKLRK